MVHVGMGEHDAADGCAEFPCGGKNVIRRTGETGVDEAEAIRLANQVAVHESQAGKLIGISSDRGGFHPVDSMRTACLRSNIRGHPISAFEVRHKSFTSL